MYYNDKILEAEDADAISNLKLQKLLYYAQGCYLGLEGHPLFDENIIDWTHGPVAEEVYYRYRNNGYTDIVSAKYVKYRCKFSMHHDTILFSFKYMTNQKEFNWQKFKNSGD